MNQSPPVSEARKAVAVRRAGLADAEALARLLAAFLQEEGKGPDEAVKAAELARWLAPPAPRFQALIGLQARRPCGYLAYYGAFSLFKPGPVLLVENIYVEPAARRSGLGQRLMAAAAAEGQRLGFQRLELHVRADSEKAGAFYESLGMAAAGEAVYRIEDGDLARLAARFD